MILAPAYQESDFVQHSIAKLQYDYYNVEIILH